MGKKLRAVALGLAFACAVPLAFAGCGPADKGDDVDIDDEGNVIVRPGSKEAQVDFWINGDDYEIDVFGTLTDEFNAANKGVIKVNMVNRTGTDYDSVLAQALATTPPDVFYVGDSGYKEYAELGYLKNLDDYIKTSKDFVVEDMWDNVVQRYKYDVSTYLSGTEAGSYYGVPKDLGPTVIYYNETYFEGAGIKILSVDKDHLEAFNGGAADDRGNTKAQLGITGTVKEKGYFQDGANWYFNNQIPMSWDETVACAQKVQNYMRTTLNKSQGYGYFTEWWFNYGWSVGGNCIQQIPSELYDCGYYYDFTLVDDTKNYIVADDVTELTVNNVKYTGGQLIEYKDKLDMSVYDGKKAADGVDMYQNRENYKITQEVLNYKEQGKLVELPSQKEAFVEFLRIGPNKNSKNETITIDGKECYNIAPFPTDIDGDSGKINEFIYGQLGMLVDGRWNVTKFREEIPAPNEKDGFVWDVAPLPMYKQYDQDGNITVHGVEAGHSGSVALCISEKSTVATAAWKFIEFCAGSRGQTLQAEKGFAIPLQKSLANSEVFLQSDKMPKNSKVFIRATEYEVAGDWWILKNNAWIDDWAGILNSSVRNGATTFADFIKCAEYKGTFAKLEEYTKNKAK